MSQLPLHPLPPQAIDEFQALWKKYYGVELPREQAVTRAHQMFNFVRLLAQDPNAPDDFQARD